MRKLILFVFALCFSLTLASQSEKKNMISFVTSPFGSVLYEYKGDVQGGASYDGKFHSSFGIEYSRNLSNSFEISSGILFSHNKIKSTSSYYPGTFTSVRNFTVNCISVPLIAKVSIFDYLFLNTGGIINIRISGIDKDYISYDDNTLAFFFGIGGAYTFSTGIHLSANPFVQLNNLSPNRTMDFINYGVKLGVGYKF